MPRVTKAIDASVNQLESAKETAAALMKDTTSIKAIDLFYSEDLKYIENGIKNLNDFSSKSWLLSAILIYTLIYDKGLFAKTGLSWYEYSKQARERLGLDEREISEQLSSARFFIRHHKELERQGFHPLGNYNKLCHAELAEKLSGDVHAVIKHIVNDTWSDFKLWYSSFKEKKALPVNENYRDDIVVKNSRFYINKVEAVKVSDKIPKADKAQIEKYLAQIFEIMKNGDVPAIVSTYNEKEARILPRLRDKYRQGK